jgi:hypothetical protein
MRPIYVLLHSFYFLVNSMKFLREYFGEKVKTVQVLKGWYALL